MTEVSILQTLQDLEFTRDLEPYQLEKLASMSHMVSFEADQIIFREADIGKFLYLVDSGQVAIEIRVPGQGRTTILTVGPGELLGWSSLFPSGRKTAGARTVTATRAIAVDAQRLRDTMFEDHDLGCAILWRITDVIAGRLKATRLQLLDIFAPSSAL